MKHAIGIDFGTTKTLVSWFNPKTNQVELVRLGQRGTDKIPTSIYYDQEKGFLFGEDADDQMEFAAERYKRAFKLELGSNTPSLFIDKETKFKAVELTREFLKYIKEQCEENVFMGESVSDAVITMPVAFSPAQQKELKQAALDAGFLNVSLLPEPEAAGRAFAYNNPTESYNSMMIVDWGGGTVDFAMVSRSGEKIQVNADSFDGDTQLGGEAFDELLWGYVADKIQKSDNQNRNPYDEPLEIVNNMQKKVRECKEKLSKTPTARILFAGSTGPYSTSVTQDEFSGIINDSVEEIGDRLNALLQKIQRRGGHYPEALLMIGGSSSIPLVQKILAEKSNLRCVKWQYFHEAVAIGAGIVAGNNSTSEATETKTASAQQQTSFCEKQSGFAVPSYDEIVEDHSKLDFLKKLADEGCAEAQYTLGEIYNLGHNDSLIEENPEQSFFYFSKAASQGHKEAEFTIGVYHFYGYGTPVNYEKAYFIFSADKFKADDRALAILGRMYAKGLFVQQDINKAIDFLKQAVEQDNDGAMVELALIYDGRVEFGEVEKLLRSAVQLGNSRAMALLGKYYVNHDQSNEGVELLKSAADLNNVDAMTDLGAFYYEHEQTDAALKLWKNAVEVNSPDAFYYMSVYSFDNNRENDGIRYLEQAVALGSETAMLDLGSRYRDGNCVKKDLQKALDYFIQAEECGNSKGSLLAGAVYYFNLEDSRKAEAYWEKAAALGDGEAVELLLQCFKRVYSEREEALLDAMSKIVNSARKLENFFPIKRVPQKKLINAWESYGLEQQLDETTILGLYDSTVFGGAKDGFILTWFGIAWHNIFEDSVSLSWEDMKEIESKNDLFFINDQCISILDDSVAVAQLVLKLKNCYMNYFNNYGMYTTVDEILDSLSENQSKKN